ncbi:chemotaxis protein CheW [Vagococcus penaei]|uniref:CheW-like domain-containing protein n=1 Tax=Vagococcus penaei TaxID=633807 RepID=A0A1Q2D8D6_9ENTE|nr:CheW domain-containing protein [Vagococcus penaei]AQP54581.1 hypothetical protein BW732_10460 [Vagococcus penaei]
MRKQIVFISHNQKFCLPIEQIEKIIQWEEPTKVLQHDAFILGVIKYNNQVLPVIDLAECFFLTLSPITSDSKYIITNLAGDLLCLLVDDIQGIVDFDDNQFEHVSEESLIEKEFIASFVKTPDAIITELDLTAIKTLKDSQNLVADDGLDDVEMAES